MPVEGKAVPFGSSKSDRARGEIDTEEFRTRRAAIEETKR